MVFIEQNIKGTRNYISEHLKTPVSYFYVRKSLSVRSEALKFFLDFNVQMLDTLLV